MTEPNLLPLILKASKEATDRLNEYHDEIVQRRRQDLHDVTSFAARWAEQAWRMCVVLHAGCYGPQAHLHEVSLETADKAICITKWFVRQQLDLLAQNRQKAAEKQEDQVLELFERIQSKEGRSYVTSRDVQRKRITRDNELAKALLARMEHDGLLFSEVYQPPSGGSPSERYFRKIENNPAPE